MSHFFFCSKFLRLLKFLFNFLGWCPVEDDHREATYLHNVLNFTIFIKNAIEFPIFNVKHSNMIEDLKPCIFHPINNTNCPIFRLDYIINEVVKDHRERELMLNLGGVIRIKIDWDCNLDYNIKLCKPIYSFARLDTPFHDEVFSVGFNFRFASHWKYNGEYLRLLRKVYGLRLVISVSGEARKFDIITLTLKTGSMISIFGLATLLCDVILLNLTPKASIYRDFVFQRPVARTNNRSSKDYHDEDMTNHIDIRDEQRLSSIKTSKFILRFSAVTDTVHPSVPNQTLKSQPKLGLTNVIIESTI